MEALTLAALSAKNALYLLIFYSLGLTLPLEYYISIAIIAIVIASIAVIELRKPMQIPISSSDKNAGITIGKTGKKFVVDTLFWFAWYVFHPNTELYAITN